MNPSFLSELHYWLAALIVTSARITPAFFMLPFFSGSVVSVTIRTPVIIAIGAALWPHPFDALTSLPLADMLALVMQETLIGLLLALLLVLPFWIMHGLGAIIDNQRGATLSSTFDPISGIDTSELANLFNLLFAALFLQGGGLTLLLEVYYSSYRLCDPLAPCLPQLPALFGLLQMLMSRILSLASPVLAALLLTELLLGLLSRFAPQMNAFSISLTLKSGVTFLILLLYFTPLLPDLFRQQWLAPQQLERWIILKSAPGESYEQ